MPKYDVICETEVLDQALPGPVISLVQNLTVYDLLLRKVISPSFELRFGSSWTLWKAN